MASTRDGDGHSSPEIEVVYIGEPKVPSTQIPHRTTGQIIFNPTYVVQTTPTPVTIVQTNTLQSTATKITTTSLLSNTVPRVRQVGKQLVHIYTKEALKSSTSISTITPPATRPGPSNTRIQNSVVLTSFHTIPTTQIIFSQPNPSVPSSVISLPTQQTDAIPTIVLDDSNPGVTQLPTVIRTSPTSTATSVQGSNSGQSRQNEDNHSVDTSSSPPTSIAVSLPVPTITAQVPKAVANKKPRAPRKKPPKKNKTLVPLAPMGTSSAQSITSTSAQVEQSVYNGITTTTMINTGIPISMQAFSSRNSTVTNPGQIFTQVQVPIRSILSTTPSVIVSNSLVRPISQIQTSNSIPQTIYQPPFNLPSTFSLVRPPGSLSLQSAISSSSIRVPTISHNQVCMTFQTTTNNAIQRSGTTTTANAYIHAIPNANLLQDTTVRPAYNLQGTLYSTPEYCPIKYIPRQAITPEGTNNTTMPPLQESKRHIASLDQLISYQAQQHKKSTQYAGNKNQFPMQTQTQVGRSSASFTAGSTTVVTDTSSFKQPLSLQDFVELNSTRAISTLNSGVTTPVQSIPTGSLEVLDLKSFLPENAQLLPSLGQTSVASNVQINSLTFHKQEKALTISRNPRQVTDLAIPQLQSPSQLQPQHQMSSALRKEDVASLQHNPNSNMDSIIEEVISRYCHDVPSSLPASVEKSNVIVTPGRKKSAAPPRQRSKTPKSKSLSPDSVPTASVSNSVAAQLPLPSFCSSFQNSSNVFSMDSAKSYSTSSENVIPPALIPPITGPSVNVTPPEKRKRKPGGGRKKKDNPSDITAPTSDIPDLLREAADMARITEEIENIHGIPQPVPVFLNDQLSQFQSNLYSTEPNYTSEQSMQDIPLEVPDNFLDHLEAFFEENPPEPETGLSIQGSLGTLAMENLPLDQTLEKTSPETSFNPDLSTQQTEGLLARALDMELVKVVAAKPRKPRKPYVRKKDRIVSSDPNATSVGNQISSQLLNDNGLPGAVIPAKVKPKRNRSKKRTVAEAACAVDPPTQMPSLMYRSTSELHNTDFNMTNITTDHSIVSVSNQIPTQLSYENSGLIPATVKQKRKNSKEKLVSEASASFGPSAQMSSLTSGSASNIHRTDFHVPNMTIDPNFASGGNQISTQSSYENFGIEVPILYTGKQKRKSSTKKPVPEASSDPSAQMSSLVSGSTSESYNTDFNIPNMAVDSNFAPVDNGILTELAYENPELLITATVTPSRKQPNDKTVPDASFDPSAQISSVISGSTSESQNTEFNMPGFSVPISAVVVPVKVKKSYVRKKKAITPPMACLPTAVGDTASNMVQEYGVWREIHAISDSYSSAQLPALISGSGSEIQHPDFNVPDTSIQPVVPVKQKKSYPRNKKVTTPSTALPPSAIGEMNNSTVTEYGTTSQASNVLSVVKIKKAPRIRKKKTVEAPIFPPTDGLVPQEASFLTQYKYPDLTAETFYPESITSIFDPPINPQSMASANIPKVLPLDVRSSVIQSGFKFPNYSSPHPMTDLPAAWNINRYSSEKPLNYTLPDSPTETYAALPASIKKSPARKRQTKRKLVDSPIDLLGGSTGPSVFSSMTGMPEASGTSSITKPVPKPKRSPKKKDIKSLPSPGVELSPSDIARIQVPVPLMDFVLNPTDASPHRKRSSDNTSSAGSARLMSPTSKSVDLKLSRETIMVTPIIIQSTPQSSPGSAAAPVYHSTPNVSWTTNASPTAAGLIVSPIESKPAVNTDCSLDIDVPSDFTMLPPTQSPALSDPEIPKEEKPEIDEAAVDESRPISTSLASDPDPDTEDDVQNSIAIAKPVRRRGRPAKYDDSNYSTKKEVQPTSQSEISKLPGIGNPGFRWVYNRVELEYLYKEGSILISRSDLDLDPQKLTLWCIVDGGRGRVILQEYEPMLKESTKQLFHISKWVQRRSDGTTRKWGDRVLTILVEKPAILYQDYLPVYVTMCVNNPDMSVLKYYKDKRTLPYLMDLYQITPEMRANFVDCLRILIFQAADPKFVNCVINDDLNQAPLICRLRNSWSVMETTIKEGCLRILSSPKWTTHFWIEFMKYAKVMYSSKNVVKTISCIACMNPVHIPAKTVQFSGPIYNISSLEIIADDDANDPDKPNPDLQLCYGCSYIVKEFHSLYHVRFHMLATVQIRLDAILKSGISSKTLICPLNLAQHLLSDFEWCEMMLVEFYIALARARKHAEAMEKLVATESAIARPRKHRATLEKAVASESPTTTRPRKHRKSLEKSGPVQDTNTIARKRRDSVEKLVPTNSDVPIPIENTCEKVSSPRSNRPRRNSVKNSTRSEDEHQTEESTPVGETESKII